MMRTTRMGLIGLTATVALFVLGAGATKAPERKSAGSRTATETSQRATQPALRPQTTLDVSTVEEPTVQQTLNQAPNYYLDWWSVNGGGDIAASSANYQMGLSIGQGAAGSASSANFAMGIGFWYGAAGAGGGVCPITMTGDVNTDASITSADIIYLVGYVFKGGPAPMPCEAAGDVNCNGSVTSADIIYLVAYVFKGGPAPCDVCTLVPGTWTCP